MPPVRITKVMPSATTEMNELCSRMFRMFSPVAKASKENEAIRHSTARTTREPRRWAMAAQRSARSSWGSVVGSARAMVVISGPSFAGRRRLSG